MSGEIDGRITVPVHRDILQYEEKVYSGVTARQAVGFFGAAVTAAAVTALLHFALGMSVDGAMYPAAACTVPFVLYGFWRPQGLDPVVYAKLAMQTALGRQRLAYRTNSDPVDRTRPRRWGTKAPMEG